MKSLLIYQDHNGMYPPMGALYVADYFSRAGIGSDLMSVNDDLSNVNLNDYGLFGMSVITSEQIRKFVEKSKEIKSKTDAPVIWGGTHPTLNQGQCEDENYIDIVLPGFVGHDKYNQHSKGALDRLNPRWDKLKNLSRFLYPEDHSVRDGQSGSKNIFYYLNTSRGCCFNCSYCSVPVTSDRKVLTHSPWWVEGQLEEIRARLGLEGRKMDGIGIWDDMFWNDMKRAKQIVEVINNKDLGYLIECRADKLLSNNSSLYKYLKDTRCYQVFVGAESANNDTLNMINKGSRVEQYEDLISMADKLKMNTRFSLIVGFPYETDESVNQTIDFAEKIRNSPYCSVSGPKLFTPYPGTLEYDRAVERGFETPKDTLDWANINRSTRDYKERFPWVKENLSDKTIKRLDEIL